MHWKKTIYFYWPLIIGLFICLSLHFARTYIDAQDIHYSLERNIPEFFKNDPKYEDLRTQVLNRPIYLDTDCYYWVLYASDMVRDGKWRVRYSTYDNVPYGREVAWNSGYSWFLVGLGKIDSLISGRGIINAIEHAAGWSNPILIALFATFWAIVLAVKFNPYIGGVFPFLILFLWSFQVGAGYAVVDHHTLHNMLFLSQMLAIIMGGAGIVSLSSMTSNGVRYRYQFLRSPQYIGARNWFIAAGCFGAMGLWVGATQQAVLIASLGIGGALATFIFRDKSSENTKNDIAIIPKVWRWWGYSGAILSLVFYLIEYFPNHMTMRLEVNHPLYALAWACGAEFIYRVAMLCNYRLSTREKREQYRYMAYSLLGVIVLPVAVIWGPDNWHTIHDPIMRRVHDNITEFLPPFRHLSYLNFKIKFIDFGLLPLFWFVAIVLVWSDKIERYHRILLFQALSLSLFLLGFYLLQTRWSGLLAVTLVGLSLVSISALGSRFWNKKFLSIGLAALLLALIVPGNVIFFWENYVGSRDLRVNRRLKPLVNSLLAREVAINLFVMAGSEEVRFIANSSFAPYLAFYGVGRSVGSLYWPNRQGIHDYARFFADTGDKQALEIARQRGLTHVLFKIAGTEIARRSSWALYGSNDRELLERTLAYRLAKNPTSPPDWLEPFPIFYSPRSQKNGNVIYKIKLDSGNGSE